jgi:predicted RNA-binding protein with TRAM domain
MNIPEQLSCLFTAEVQAQDDSYTIEIPKNEIETGYANLGNNYRVAVLTSPTESSDTVEPSPDTSQDSQQPPVTEGETRTVEIEDIGDQGDGITRVERGFVIIVGDTEKGEQVRIKIDTVQENVAFATVVERLSYYD